MQQTKTQKNIPRQNTSNRTQVSCITGSSVGSVLNGNKKHEYYLKNRQKKIDYQYRDNGLMKTWNCLKTRCTNEKHPKYKYYGGKGIKIEWKDYQGFKADMYETYLTHISEHSRADTTLDKIDNSKNYSKENCRWATMKEQNDNRGNSNKRIVK